MNNIEKRLATINGEILPIEEEKVEINSNKIPIKYDESASMDIALQCEDCGVVSADVFERFDPYDEDVNGEQNIIQVCSDCFNNRADEI